MYFKYKRKCWVFILQDTQFNSIVWIMCLVDRLESGQAILFFVKKVKKKEMWVLRLYQLTTTLLDNAGGYSDGIHAARGSCGSAVLGISHFHNLTAYCFLKKKNNIVRDCCFFFQRCGFAGGLRSEVGQRKPGPHGFHQAALLEGFLLKWRKQKSTHTHNNLCVTSQRIQAFPSPMGSLLIESDTCLFLRVTVRN